jgi:hypothetical protein
MATTSGDRQYVAREIGIRWPAYLQSIVNHKNEIKKLWLLDLDELLKEHFLAFAIC